jgi:uncharacterized tellurite resistance protein B-like protein
MANPQQLTADQLKLLRDITDQYDDLNSSASTYISNIQSGLRDTIENLNEKLQKERESLDNLSEEIELMIANGQQGNVNFNNKLNELNVQRDLVNNIQNTLLLETKRNEIHQQQMGILATTVSHFSQANVNAGKLYGTIKNLGNSQFVFLTLINLSAERFSELDMAGENFRKTTGLLASQTGKIEKNIRQASLELGRFGVDVEKASLAAQQLVATFGSDFAASNKANVEYVALMSENLGVSAEDSTKVMQNFMGMGKMSSETARYTSAAAVSLSKAAGVPLKQVMTDVAKASGDTLALVRGSVTQLIKASVEARRLGTSLDAVGSSASKLLDFQSSIGEEMEASVLMGKDLNLQRARELAYAGDLTGLAQEQARILNEVGDARKLDFFQQKALANALGLSVEQMTQMNAKQQELSELRKQDPDFAKKYEQEMRKINDLGKESESDLKKRYETEIKTQQIQAAQTKLANQFKTLLVQISDAFSPIFKVVEWIAWGLEKVVGWISLANEKTDGWASTILLIFALWKMNAISALVSPLKTGISLLGTYFTKFKLLGSQKTTPATPIAGGGMGGGLTQSIRGINPAQLLAVGAAMIAFAGAVLILAHASKVFGSPEAQAGFEYMAIAAVGLAIIGAALIGFSSAITAAAPVLLPAIGILLGFAASIGVLALASMGFGKAFQMFVEGFERAMSLDLFTLSAGFYALSSAMMAFGVSMAMGGIGSFLGGGMLLQLIGLATIAPALYLAAESINAISKGIESFSNTSVDGIKAVTQAIKELNEEINNVSLLKVGALAALNLSAGVAGGSNGSSDAVVKKLDELIGLMNSGGIAVNIDGSRANYLLARGQKERGALGAV